MDALRWLIGGLIGAAIGAAIWVAVGHFTGYEVGWIAWGVGFLAGLGVRATAGNQQGAGPGATAVGMAVLAIVLAKYAVIVLAVNQALPDLAALPADDPNFVIAGYADELVAQREAAGEQLKWPPGAKLAETPIEQSYPPNIWAAASRRWQALPPDEQQTAMRQRRAVFAGKLEEFKGAITDQAFQESFTAFDLLWFGLAALTAFRLGSGATDEEEGSTEEGSTEEAATEENPTEETPTQK